MLNGVTQPATARGVERERCLLVSLLFLAGMVVGAVAAGGSFSVGITTAMTRLRRQAILAVASAAAVHAGVATTGLVVVVAFTGEVMATAESTDAVAAAAAAAAAGLLDILEDSNVHPCCAGAFIALAHGQP